MVLFHLIFLLCTISWPKTRVHIDLFFIYTRQFDQKLGPSLIYFSYFYTNISPKIRILIDLFFFICTRPFNQIIWYSFIYFFFSARPFDQRLRSSLIYFFHLHKAIRKKNIRSSLIYSFIMHDHVRTQKVGSSSIYFFYLRMTIQQKYMFVFHLFFLCAGPFDLKWGFSLIYFFICTRPFDQS